MPLRKAGGNWVAGDQFFDRDIEIEALTERVEDGIHTLVTAQRRMGKTSLVRELLRRLEERGDFEPVFVDLEDASSAADALVEIAAVLVIDELPILVNRLLKGHDQNDYKITPERRRDTDEFMSWLRKNAQAHRGRIRFIVSGSVGLEPILEQAGLSDDGYRFVSGLVEDWWRSRNSRGFVPFSGRQA